MAHNDNVARSDLRRRLLHGSAWSISFQLVSKSSLFVVGAIIARQISVRDLGVFFAVQGALILGSALIDRGVSLSVEREAAISALSPRTLRTLMNLRIAEGFAVGGIALVALKLIEKGLSNASCAFFALAAASVYTSYLSNSFLQSQQRFRDSATIQSAGRIIYLLLVLTVFSVWPSVTTAAAAWAVGELSTAVVQNVVGRQALHKFRLADHLASVDRLRAVYRRALPYWIAMVAFLAYNRADSAICLFFSGPVQAGYYGPASNLQTALMIVPAGLTASLAVIGASSLKDREISMSGILHEINRLTRLAVAASIGASVIVTVLAPLIIAVFVGPRFDASILPTRILVWSLPFNAIQGAMTGMLVALGAPKRTVYFYVSCFVTSIALNAALTPQFGAAGAAVAALVREPIGTLILLYTVRSTLRATIRGDTVSETDTYATEAG